MPFSTLEKRSHESLGHRLQTPTALGLIPPTGYEELNKFCTFFKLSGCLLLRLKKFHCALCWAKRLEARVTKTFKVQTSACRFLHSRGGRISRNQSSIAQTRIRNYDEIFVKIFESETWHSWEMKLDPSMWSHTSSRRKIQQWKKNMDMPATTSERSRNITSFVKCRLPSAFAPPSR